MFIQDCQVLLSIFMLILLSIESIDNQNQPDPEQHDIRLPNVWNPAGLPGPEDCLAFSMAGKRK